MAKNKTMLYRQDGFVFVVLYLMEHSLDDLGEEIKLREASGIKTILSFDELNSDKRLEHMKGYVEQAHNVIWSRALRELGFAKKRISRNLERVISNRPATVQEAFYRKEFLAGELKKILRDKRYDNEPDVERMPSRSVMEYIKEREEGIRYGYEYVKKHGLKEFRRLLTRTKFNANMVIHENDYANDLVRGLINEVCILEWLLSIHDLEGYGNKRLNRVMDHFETCYSKVMDRKEGYENYLEELEKITGEWLADEYLKEDIKYDRVKHKKKKPKKKPKEETEPKVELPPIEEPDEYSYYPCPGCPSKSRCRSEGYQKECTCLALYKEVRKENLRRNIA